MKEEKEVGVFNSYSGYNKLKIIGISILIFLVASTLLYMFVKSLFKYTVTYNFNGGQIYKQELKSDTYRFLQKVNEPKSVKKEGYYIEYWSKDENFKSRFKFGSRIWNSFTLNVKWADGVAVRLHFAEGEENSDMPLDDLKGYYEQYVKPGSTYSLPLVFNTKEGSHYGEQLLWYDNPECTGTPFSEKTYELNENIDIYGAWFDTDSSKFEVDENGVLNKYLGYCNKIILPNNIKKIKDIAPDRFRTGASDGIHDSAGIYQSAWANVISDETGLYGGLRIVYINSEMETLGDCAFRDCKALEKLIFLGDNISSIGKYAFANCQKISYFDLPTKVTEIKEGTFHNTFAINKKVEMYLANVTTISDNAFQNSHVAKITLPKVTFIGKGAFKACNYLTNLTILTPNTIVISNYDGTNDKLNTNSIFYGVTTDTSVVTHLKIYVPHNLKSSYLTKIYWNMYSDIIYESEQ